MDRLEIAKNFKKELRELLEKYHASIDVGYADCSDTHGMYDEHMMISFGDPSGKRQDFGIRVCDNWYIDANELKEDR